MKNQLYTYDVIVPLRYYTYDLHSNQKDSEYVMGLKEDIEWDVTISVREPIADTNQIFENQEKVHFHLFCEKDQEHDNIPADFFSCKITNIVAHEQEEARLFVKPYLYKICRTLSFFLSKHNCNKQSYQPRVESDMEHSEWEKRIYEPFEQLVRKGETDNSIETIWSDGKKHQVITVEMAPLVISTSVYIKIYGKMPVDDFLLYTECTDADLNFMLDEFYLALGQENSYSKFFHLFSIIEFVEKRYADRNGAQKLLALEETESILNAVSACVLLDEKEKRDRVHGALKQALVNLTDIGRKEKLVHILHQMGVFKVENCGTEFEIDSKTIGQIINLRNKCYHGDRKKNKQTYIDVDLAVTRLMYICEKIISSQLRKD